MCGKEALSLFVPVEEFLKLDFESVDDVLAGLFEREKRVAAVDSYHLHGFLERSGVGLREYQTEDRGRLDDDFRGFLELSGLDEVEEVGPELRQQVGGGEDTTLCAAGDFLEEEAMEEDLVQVMNRVEQAVTQTAEVPSEQEKREQRMKKIVVDEEAVSKMYSYIELNYGRSYLTKGEQERLNRTLCRGAHADCSLYYTDGILSGMVKRNYQSEYARRAKSDNLRVYGHNTRVARRNIEQLSDTLRRSLTVRSERETVRSEYGSIVPARLWKPGRSRDRKLFDREIKKDSSEFVVHVLIDASGSQKSRQSLVALQGYIISEALSIVGIPHRVMGFCTFWDYTVMQRFRDYDDPREANKRIFEFHASSNNRDGLAIRAAAASLRERPEENKVLIVLSDGRPNDIIVNRPNSRNPAPYSGDYAVRDTATEVRKVRAEGISVLGVFAGEEQDLMAERRIFGRDFAYIRNIMNFSSIVGLYLRRQLADTP